MVLHGLAPDTKPLMLLIGSGERRNKEYILRSITTRYRLWLLQPTDVTWEEPYIVGNTIVDNTDPASLVETARSVVKHHEISGVFCYDEWIVWPAAHVSQALGLPGNSPEVITACRDKHATRAALDLAGVDQPASIGARSQDEAAAAAEKIGYPVVLKPRGLSASQGVVRADNNAELRAAFAVASHASWPGVPVFEMAVLVEEYVDGEEISIDAALFDGECVPLAIARKQVAFEPYFEEVGHAVDGADLLLADDGLRDLLHRCHAALGFHTGCTHTEWRLTSRGPRLIEVNARLGGEMIPYLAKLATGVDIAMAAADIAAGRRPDTKARHRQTAAITCLYPEQDIQVESVVVREEAFTPDIHSALALVSPGTVLRLPPRGYGSRYGHVIAVSDTIEKARAALAGARNIVRLTAHPAKASS